MADFDDFRAVFERTANPYMVLDRELRYVAANRAYLEVTAARLEDLIGRPILEVFPNDPANPNNRSAQILRASLEKVLASRRRDFIAFIPYRVARVAGGPLEERFWSATHTPILDDHGEVAYILQHTVDVTELHNLKAVARRVGVDLSAPSGIVESEVLRRASSVQDSYVELGTEMQHLRQLFDQAPTFVCFLRGPEHVYELANRAYERLIGRAGIVGKRIREALPELTGQGFFELLDRVYATRQPYLGHAVTVTLEREGEREEVIVDFVYQPILGPDGTTSGILVQGNDVTARTRIEVRQRFLARASEALAASGDVDEALRQVGVAAVDGFADWCTIDLVDDGGAPRRMVLAADRPGWAELATASLRFVPQGVADDHPSLGPAAMRPILVREFTPAMAERWARGPEHLAWLRTVGFRSALGVPLVVRGKRLGVITLAMSATMRRFNEDDLTAAEELARMASTVIDNSMLSRERAELLEREQAARERAEAANQAKDEFLAMLGHELRNPLSPILTAVQLLRLRGDRGSEREQTIIERQAQHLIRLVDDLLDVSRITRGKVQLDKAPFDLADAIASAVEMASPLFEGKQHRLQLDVPRDRLFVDGDAVRLGQVIANLLTNAARYTDEGGLIRVSGAVEGERVVVRVRDNGIGIPAEVLPRIFDMFVQGPRRNDRGEGGLGLGLTLVRTLVNMHGGTVSVASAGPGRGSEFTIRLPRAAAPVVEAAPAATLAPHDGGRRVLIVDDNVDAAELLAEMLELRGFRTALAHDGPTALGQAREFQPELAVLDIGLPVMDGYELAAQLRQLLGARAPRMIALTGYGQLDDRKKTAAAGFAAHLVKPIDADALFRALSDADGPG